MAQTLADRRRFCRTPGPREISFAGAGDIVTLKLGHVSVIVAALHR
jgi:hypothetical protein